MYDSKLRSKDADIFMEALLSLKTVDECYMFLEDLCTVPEINSICQRLKIAMLLKDKYTTGEVSSETGASTATVSRVNKCLKYGTGGYKMIMDRLENK